MNCDREDYMRRQEADHELIRMRQPQPTFRKPDSHPEVALARTQGKALADELAAQIERAKRECPNAPYVPVKVETAEAIVAAIRAGM